MKIINTLLFSIFTLCFGMAFDLACIEKNATKIKDKETLHKIYKKLVESIGDSETAKPELVIRDSENYVAAYSRRDNIIIIEKKAINICKSFNEKYEDALAFLIGHELAHFYQNHDWDMGFATSFLSEKETFNAKCKSEQEADTYGAFMAYLSGYDIINISASMLEKIYEGYNIPDNISKYPSLDERKSVAKNAKNKAIELIRIYEFANYCSATGRNIQAKFCYDYLLNFIKTKEIYNNAGLATLAIGLSNKTCFKYPITLDLNNIINIRSGYEYFDGKKDLAQRAISYFRKAQNMDRYYVSALINKAIAYTLFEEDKYYEKARSILETTLNISKKIIEKEKVAIVKAIIYYEQNNHEEAIKILKDLASNSTNELIKNYAAYNSAIIEGGDCDHTIIPQISIEDKIDAINLRKVSEKFNNNILLNKKETILFHIAFEEKPNSLITRFKIDNDGTITSFYLQQTTSLSLETKKGIKTGASYQAIKKAYPNAKMIESFHQKGKIIQLLDHKLIFILNEKDLVTEWSISN